MYQHSILKSRGAGRLIDRARWCRIISIDRQQNVRSSAFPWARSIRILFMYAFPSNSRKRRNLASPPCWQCKKQCTQRFQTKRPVTQMHALMPCPVTKVSCHFCDQAIASTPRFQDKPSALHAIKTIQAVEDLRSNANEAE